LVFVRNPRRRNNQNRHQEVIRLLVQLHDIHNLIASGGNWTVAAVDTAVHEGVHKFVAKFLGPIWDIGEAGVKHHFGAGVMWAEETVAYALGHTATGRIHGLVYAPYQAFRSVFQNFGGGAAGRNAVAWAAAEVALVGGGIAAYFGLRNHPQPQGAAP
jgi:hypothetical protein